MSDHTGYVFSKYERDKHWVGYVLICLSILVVIGMAIYKRLSDPDASLRFIYFLIGFIVFLCIVGWFNQKYRYAQYSFMTDSVQMKVGKEQRIIYQDDMFFITLIHLMIGERYGTYTEKFYVLWKAAKDLPAEESNPYRVLKKGKAILLPYNESISHMLQDSLNVKEIYEFPAYSFNYTKDGRKYITKIRKKY